jgi:hypothetical protein
MKMKPDREPIDWRKEQLPDPKRRAVRPDYKTYPYIPSDKTKPLPVNKLSDNEPTKFELSLWELTDELADLLLKKHKDYGPKNIADAPGGALNGLRVRIHDKTARINNLVDSGAKPENESLEDSFKDLANYAIIALMVLRGQWSK